MTAVGRYPKLTFLVGALAISSLSGWVVASPRFDAHAGLLSYAVLADLVVTMPVFYYYVVIRGRSVSPATVLPIVMLGLIRARMLIPAKQLPGVELLVGLAEVVALAWLGTRAVQLRRMPRHVGIPESTFADTFAEAVRESFGKSPFTGFVISEVSILYYALFSWRAEAEIPGGAVATTSHRRSGWSGVLVGVGMIIVVESVATHFLIALWNAKLAWVLSALSAYGILWLIGDYRAMALRPTFLTSTMLRLRIGIRWKVDIPLDEIRSAAPYRPSDASLPGYRKVTVIGNPRWTVQLHRPVVLEGPFGIRRPASSLGIATDHTEFDDALLRLRQLQKPVRAD
jgi:hypothetical protein